MSLLNLATAIYTRWSDAGLNSSVTTLYWGDAAPEGTAMPRAVYEIPSDDKSDLSRGSMIHIVRLRFKAWNETPELVTGYINSIQSKFHNSEKAATSPLNMSGGNINSCLYATSGVIQEDEEAYMGVVDFDIQWQETNSIPS